MPCAGLLVSRPPYSTLEILKKQSYFLMSWNATPTALGNHVCLLIFSASIHYSTKRLSLHLFIHQSTTSLLVLPSVSIHLLRLHLPSRHTSIHQRTATQVHTKTRITQQQNIEIHNTNKLSALLINHYYSDLLHRKSETTLCHFEHVIFDQILSKKKH